ncbi:MAG: NAD(P)/FAD-dependent oxidoreductase, partial [Chthoniobacterales bacterium]
LRTLLLEREKFPREKVCGDCLNPSCTPVLERLGVAHRVRELPHGKLRRVDFIAIGGKTISVDLPDDAEIAVKRGSFDQLLMQCATDAGAEVREGFTVSQIAPNESWKVSGDEARVLVAADGRNSSVARALGLLPRIEKERVALQTHLPLPRDFGDRVVLQFLPEGYSGQAPVSESELNLCLVGKPSTIASLKSWAEANFALTTNHQWRTITPLRRRAISPAHQRLLLVGDAARVVEPFTGEGIYYALRSGELAAEAIIAERLESYARAHEELYRGRLWINRIARTAVLSPHLTSTLMKMNLLPPRILRLLTSKIL